MLRTREELSRFFSDELIDHEVKRVKEAKVGSTVFSMEVWEADDWVVSILELAEVCYHSFQENGMVIFIKDAPLLA